jgi:hypothetical protein
MAARYDNGVACIPFELTNGDKAPTPFFIWLTDD